MKFSIKDFFSKCDQIGSLLRIWHIKSYKKSYKKDVEHNHFLLPKKRYIGIWLSNLNKLKQWVPFNFKYSYYIY